ncbi:catalase [Volvox carteri f. nagariensis]|uniref:Catalase n=1 Tax=Volvox carteri f. nagariensis TaxID=3068 RepID=D8UCP0_VOLCA|nr:catalase [Volvox carteri f. nagariensis]EFJ42526.1 catalase [Volvox carteri f. nagariensis]|eukprot:XP_002956382.1 catalase [Volvox carteri f. nagariensis]
MAAPRFLCAVLISILATQAIQVAAKCPFHFGRARMDDDVGAILQAEPRRMLTSADVKAVNELNLDAVKADLKALFLDSKDWWPADFGNYGPLMIRMAWHCAGSYRTSDGRGGCDGARQRFDPERSWADNTSLDKARKLLWPIKEKYGSALSWGDLMILAGNTAIESMGGPILGFCAGRIDDADGSASEPLGPSLDQEMVAPCSVNGECEAPLGASTMELIYVNPEGPLGNPVPELSAPQIRDIFGRMAMNDSETVALVGGGHAFGKCHGACPTGPGPSPRQQPWDPWPGTCGNGTMKGKGENTFTSGFDGPWTTQPTKWDNEYYQNLLKYDWEVYMGPGGHHQWRPVKKDPSDPEELPDIIMLTADVALTRDPAYLEIAPLPPPPATLPDFKAVSKAIAKALRTASPALEGDLVGGKPYYGALFANLAYQCACSFRQTDYTGGCNGARIRFSPQKDWPNNVAMDRVLAVLEPIKASFPTLTYSDLIVLAGSNALTDAKAKGIRFCPGRSDADPNEPPAPVYPPRTMNNKIAQLMDNGIVMGLDMREMVAIQARLRSPSQQRRLGFSGSWTNDASKLTNEYFRVLLDNDWVNVTSSAGQLEMKAVGKEGIYMTPTDLAIKWDAVLSAIAQEFATDATAFYTAFASAWNKMMIADRFKGPTANECPS